MVDHDTDVRIIKTKESIKNAFFDLVTTIGFDSITVKELTNKANINRSTFYLHYENIDDLIDEYYEELISKLTVLFEREQAVFINEADRNYLNHEPYSPFVLNILKFIEKNHKLCKTLWLSQGNLYYTMKLKRFVKKTLFNNDYALINKEDLLVPESYYTAYVFSAFMGVLKQWLEGNCNESPEEIASIISTLNFRGVLVAASSNNGNYNEWGSHRY